MKYIDLTKPHGYLIWKGKQQALVSPNLLPTNEKMLVIQEGQEAFGEVVLGHPAQVNISEFERLEEEHATRPEERKLKWAGLDKFYLYRFKDWQPYPDSRDVILDNGNAELLPVIKLSEQEQRLLDQAERLPKTLILKDEAVTLEDGQVVFCEGLDGSKVMPILQATLEDKFVSDSLPLYQLALVRIPRLKLKKNMEVIMDDEKAEGLKPYKIVKGKDGCDGYSVVKELDGKVMGCHDNETEALDQMKALYASEEEDKGGRGSGKRTGPSARIRKIMGGVHRAIANRRNQIQFTGSPTRREKEFDPDEELIETLAELLTEELEPETEEGEKCGPEMEQEYIPYTITTFADLQAFETAKETAEDASEISQQFLQLTNNIMNNPDIVDKKMVLSNLAVEMSNMLKALPSQKSLDEPVVEEQPQIEDEKSGRKIKKSMRQKLEDAWVTLKEMIDWSKPLEDEEEEEASLGGWFKGQSAVGIKKVGDQYWYVTWSTNAFQDREKEIFSTKSLEKYVEEADKKLDRGYFNLWHIPNTDFAEKKWQGVAGRFLLEAGPFLDTEMGKAAFKFFKEYAEGHKELAPEGWGCSPEYRYLPEERKTGIYDNIWITRTSTLPKMAAANIWTQGGMTMALTKEQEKAAKEIFGEELTKQIIKSAEDKTKELEEAGVAHKAVGEDEPEDDAPVPEPAVIDEEVIVEKLAQKMATDWEPLKAMLEELVSNQKSLESKIEHLEDELSGARQEETKKAKEESPKYVWRLFERASEAQKTIVAEGDPLRDRKPLEAPLSDKSGAAHFFGK